MTRIGDWQQGLIMCLVLSRATGLTEVLVAVEGEADANAHQLAARVGPERLLLLERRLSHLGLLQRRRAPLLHLPLRLLLRLLLLRR